MPDVYATIRDVDPAIQSRLAEVMELRAADSRYQTLVHAYLSTIAFPPQARVLEVGCGSGSVSRTLSRWPGVDRVVGIDPSTVFIAKARALAQDIPNLEFEEADGGSLPFAAAEFDVAVMNTTLCHVPQPDKLLAEAFRVLRSRGCVAVFDGDYATATVAIAERDPLETCVQAFRDHFVHDPWLVRRLPQLVRAAGFGVSSIRSHGYTEAPQAGYMMTWIERGADALVQARCIGPATAAALKEEGLRRSAEGTWFGHISFASVVATKPA